MNGAFAPVWLCWALRRGSAGVMWELWGGWSGVRADGCEGSEGTVEMQQCPGGAEQQKQALETVGSLAGLCKSWQDVGGGES